MVNAEINSKEESAYMCDGYERFYCHPKCGEGGWACPTHNLISLHEENGGCEACWKVITKSHHDYAKKLLDAAEAVLICWSKCCDCKGSGIDNTPTFDKDVCSYCGGEGYIYENQAGAIQRLRNAVDAYMANAEGL